MILATLSSQAARWNGFHQFIDPAFIPKVHSTLVATLLLCDELAARGHMVLDLFRGSPVREDSFKSSQTIHGTMRLED